MTMVSGRADATIRRPAHWEGPYALRLLVTDVAVVTAAVMLAQYVRFGYPPVPDDSASTQLTGFSLLFIGLWLAALAIFRTRSPRVVGSGIDEYRRVLSASFWTFGAVAIGTLLLRLEIARGYLAVALPVGALGLLLGRHLWRLALARGRARGEIQAFVVGIGDRQELSFLAGELTKDPGHGYRVVGFGLPARWWTFSNSSDACGRDSSSRCATNPAR